MIGCVPTNDLVDDDDDDDEQKHHLPVRSEDSERLARVVSRILALRATNDDVLNESTDESSALEMTRVNR